MITFETLRIDYNYKTESYAVSNDVIYASFDTNCRFLVEYGKYTNRICVTIIAHDGSVAFMVYTHTIESNNAQYV